VKRGGTVGPRLKPAVRPAFDERAGGKRGRRAVRFSRRLLCCGWCSAEAPPAPHRGCCDGRGRHSRAKDGCKLLSEWANRAAGTAWAGRVVVNACLIRLIRRFRGHWHRSNASFLVGGARAVGFFAYPNKPAILTAEARRSPILVHHR